MSATEHLHSGAEGALGTIVLDRPKALNALSLAMVDALSEQLRVWRNDVNVQRVLVKAVAGRAFCAGGDIRTACETARQSGIAEATRFLRSEYQLNWRIADFPKPYIALLDGITMGGGVGISVHGSCRVATENTRFAMPETGIGFFTDIGGSYFLPRLPRHAGIYLGLTGATIGPGDCMALGLATHYMPSARVGQLETELQQPGIDVAQCLRSFEDEPPEAALSEHFDRIDDLFEPTSVADIIDRLRQDRSSFAEETLELLSSRSPLSVHVVLEQLRRGRDLDLKSCLQMEFRMVHRFFEKSDFFEGVRAALIDRDRNPRWAHRSLEEVRREEIDWYFANNSHEPLHFHWDRSAPDT